MHIQKFAAFSAGGIGGNPAGVVLADAFPAPEAMQAIAAQVGFSETAFAIPDGDEWRVRYFSPENEVPFCGHATIALGAALADARGEGVYSLRLNDARISVEARRDGDVVNAALQSPATRSRALPPTVLAEALALFGLAPAQLDPRIPAAVAHAGADHVVLILRERTDLAAMNYSLSMGRQLMLREGWTTILLGWAESARRFHTRNAFASGGVLEDPATGAATAAFAGYLRELGWPHGGEIEVLQGEDMGSPSRLHARIGDEAGSSIRVSGQVRRLAD
jgi:PhzF family phenazine biosynthesis protein